MSISHDGSFATAVCMAYESSEGAIFSTDSELERTLEAGKEELGKKGSGKRDGDTYTSRHINLMAKSQGHGGTASIFVGNLPPEATDADLVNAFGGMSTATNGSICRGTDGESLGCGFVVMSNTKNAAHAVRTKNGSRLLGNIITCGRPPPKGDPLLDAGLAAALRGSS